MRLFVSLAVIGTMVSASVSAMAQQTVMQNPTSYTQQQPSYAAPLYNGTSTNYFQTGVTGTPVYNNSSSARPLPLDQMVAGKNAPSYTYNKNKPYSIYGDDPLAGIDLSAMSPEQARLIRAQRNARAQQAQSEYMASLQQRQQQQQPGALNTPYTQAPGQMYNQLTQPEKKAPIKRRVVNKEMNNPLVTPPLLFNPNN